MTERRIRAARRRVYRRRALDSARLGQWWDAVRFAWRSLWG